MAAEHRKQDAKKTEEYIKNGYYVENIALAFAAYNNLLEHILHLKGCEVDAVSLYWG